MIFEVLTAVKMSKFFFRVATPCGMQVGKYQPFGRKKKLPPYSLLNLETECFSETLVFTHKSTWYNNAENQHRQKDYFFRYFRFPESSRSPRPLITPVLVQTHICRPPVSSVTCVPVPFLPVHV